MSSETKFPFSTGQVPLILLPGLGGDSRLFRPQRSAFPDLIVPDWIPPEQKESLAAYAARLARAIDPGVPCFLGGVSFGGVVALEVATHLKVYECFLLGSIRSSQEMPRRWRLFQSISSLVMIPKWLSPWVLSCGGRWLRPTVRGALHQVNDADGQFLRWAARSILHWHPSAGTRQVRVSQIHGDRDFVFPCGLTKSDRIVKGAGHLVSLTHSQEVNRFLQERMRQALDLHGESGNFG